MRNPGDVIGQVPPVPEVLKVGPLGQTVRQDQARPGFNLGNELLAMAGIRPDAVFIGDSLTAGWEFGPLLHDLFPVAVNRGVGGDSAKWMRKRIAADVVQLSPKNCVLMVGTNDISHRFGYDSNETIVADYARHMTEILDDIQGAGIRLFLGTVPPVRQVLIEDEHNRRKQECIPLMNDFVRKQAEARAAHGAHLVDYYPHFLADDGISLRKDLSIDACHMSSRGQYLMGLVLRAAAAPVLAENV